MMDRIFLIMNIIGSVCLPINLVLAAFYWINSPGLLPSAVALMGAIGGLICVVSLVVRHKYLSKET